MIRVAPEIEKQIIRLHLEQGRTQKSLADEYGLSTNVVGRIISNYRKECRDNAKEAENLRLMEENRRLREQNAELLKETEFLKKAAAFFARENQ
jgi:transposase